MININEAKRLIKRIILANITCDKMDLAITPLVSGKHGIGKSQMIKSIASSIGGICITIEGGTLKEGEITGLPYQYVDTDGKTKFRFLPYYAVDRIQEEEKRLYLLKHQEASINYLIGDENRYSDNELSANEKIELLKNGTVKPVIIFIDEINRTENTVYKELMNILLTRSVNGYVFPWWVFFVGAMNPSTQNSTYTTNEMDPAQLDRFLKLKVNEDAKEWVDYATSKNISSDIVRFIQSNPKCLSSDDKDLEDEEIATPSPRGWDMVDTLLKSEPYLRSFFTENENKENVVMNDMKKLVYAKLGSTVGAMFFASSSINPIPAMTLLSDDVKLTNSMPILKKMSTTKLIQTSDMLIEYLKKSADFLVLDTTKFDHQKKVIAAFMKVLDSSSKLRFAQNIADSTTVNGVSLFEILIDIFDDEILEMLNLTDTLKNFVEGKK